MTAMTLSFSFFPIRFARRPRTTESSHEDTVARRDFVCDMIEENPDAFASDFDVYHMMCHLPGKF